MITDNTAKWKAVKLTEFGNSLPVGHMYWSIEPTVPAGRLPAFGYTYNRTLYANLWAYAQERGLVITEAEWQAQASANDGNVAYYSDGDGSTTFRVPSLKCWVKGASGVEEVGSYLEAGLPNLVGTMKGVDTATQDFSDNIQCDGVFERLTDGYSRAANSNTQDYRNYFLGVGFDASRSNPIYGNSETVQPPSIVGMYLIVAFGAVHNIGEADVADVMSAVEQVQTGLSAVETKVNNIKPFMPNYNAGITNTATTTEKSYTCPADGVIVVDMAGFNGVRAYVKINDVTMFDITSPNNAASRSAVGQYAASKGDVIKYKTGYAHATYDSCKVIFFPYK